MAITKFDKPTLKFMRPSIVKALSVLEEEFGIKVTLGNATFTSSHVNVKFEMAVIGESGQAETGVVTDFKRYAYQYGLAATDLGRPFVCHGDEFIILGLRTKAPKRPIIAQGAKGKKFVFPASLVKAGLLPQKEFSPAEVKVKIDEMKAAQQSAAPMKGVTGQVWALADKMIALPTFENEPSDPAFRRAVLEACSKAGINPATAATQFNKWRKARA